MNTTGALIATAFGIGVLVGGFFSLLAMYMVYHLAVKLKVLDVEVEGEETENARSRRRSG